MTTYLNNLRYVAQAVADNLQGAEVIGLVDNQRDTIERDGYWERSYIVAWRRVVRTSQPSLDNDGWTYATHRVHVNSKNESMCYDGHYDQSRIGALHDMLERARIDLLPDVEREAALVKAMDGIHRVHLRRSGTNLIVGIVNDDVLAMELDVRQLGLDAWYASDDDGTRHHAHTLVGAIEAAREANAAAHD